MAVLTDNDRKALMASFMQELSSRREGMALTKADLRAAVNAIDTWVSDNAAAFNSAIPQPARAALTSGQKSLLLSYVVTKRYKTGV